MSKPFRLFEWVVIAILAFALLSLYYQKKNELLRKDDQITALQLANQKLDSQRRADGVTIFTQKVLLTESGHTIDYLTDTIFKMDKKHSQTIAYYKGISRTRIDSVFIPFKDTAFAKKWSDSVNSRCKEVIQFLIDSTIIVPKRFLKEDRGYRFGGTITRGGLTIDSLLIPDTLQLRIVENKGFLKRPSYTVQFFHSNPHITTTQANSVLYKPPKKPRLLEKAILVGVGILVGSKL